MQKVLHNVEMFLKLYEDYQYTDLPSQSFDVIYGKKQNALDHLNSVLYTLDNNKVVENKLIKAIYDLDNILTKYLEKMRNFSNNNYKNNPKNVYHSIIPKLNQPKGYEKYNYFNYSL